MSEKPLIAPPFDVELVPVVAAMKAAMPPQVTIELIPAMRAGLASLPVDELLNGRAITHEQTSIAVDGGEIQLSIFTKAGHRPGGPGIYHAHGGGMTMGDRFSGSDVFLEWVEKLDAVVVSVEYRLAPEFPDPTPVNDAYAGLLWTAEHAAELGFDPARLVVAGGSAGGGLAAAVTLRSRDQNGPVLAGSLLMCPMLDERNNTVSSHQIDGVGGFDRAGNDLNWNALLGTRRHTDEVSIYASPARADDLSGLPPTFIDVGTAEVFRDEAVAYATRIWERGGVAELHVWPGGFHGFDVVAPHAKLSLSAREARINWLERVLTD
jgi:acetyl esterase/lipase